MKQTKTAKGRVIDMSALAKANEEVRAVSNVPINSRGDRLDASGNVIATVQSISRAQHEYTEPVEKRRLSDATAEKPKSASSKKLTKKTNSEVGRETKVRDDGSKYVEIEYQDGSIEVEEDNK